jgi:hypothetical protein
MTPLRLQARAPTSVPLDDVLVVVVTLTNAGAAPVRTGTGLSVAADLTVIVDGPTGEVPVPWPWPADLAPPRVDLAPGASLSAGVLLAWAPRVLFDRPGRYGITCSFRPHPTEECAADRIEVIRSAAADTDMAELLARDDVARSLTAATVVDAAGPDLAELQLRGGPHARLLAALARDDLAAVAGAAQHLAEAYDPTQAAATIRAVLLDARDGRTAAVRAALAGDGRAAAVLAGVPFATT